MNTKLDFKIQTDIIGRGGMIISPRQVGQWWITPASEYEGTIPKEVQKKLFTFLNENVDIQGFLIAEDIKEIEAKKEREQKKKEATEKVIQTGLQAILVPLIGLGMGLVSLVAAVIAYDPMLIAVMSDGRWICLGTWYE